VTIKDLFDPNSTDWIKFCQKNARRSLADELEYYELMDRDSVCLDGTQVGIDSSTEAMII
jgi:hypothetical protein